RGDSSDHVVSVVGDVDISLSIYPEARRFVEARRRSCSVAVADAARSPREVSERVAISRREREWDSQRDNGRRNNQYREHTGSHGGWVLLSRSARGGNVARDF